MTIPTVDIPEVWLSFDGNGKDYPVNVRNISVDYSSPALTYSSSGSITATFPGMKTILTLDCEAAPPPADWGALIVGEDVVPMSKFRTVGRDRVEIRLTIPEGEPAFLNGIRWASMSRTGYWGP